MIGVGAAVIGDMSSRPYWGLYELDFVFSTLIVRKLCLSLQNLHAHVMLLNLCGPMQLIGMVNVQACHSCLPIRRLSCLSYLQDSLADAPVSEVFADVTGGQHCQPKSHVPFSTYSCCSHWQVSEFD